MILFLALSLCLNLDNVSAATSNSSTTKVSISQLTSAASSVNSFIKTNKRLPNYVTIASKKVTMPQYLYLLSSGTSQLSSGSTASVTLKNVNVPTKPSENLKKGNIQKTEYVSMAKSLKKYVDTNGRLPNYQSTSKGNIKFENTVDTYSKILVFYKTNKRLPTYVAVTPWTGKSYTSEGGTGTGKGTSTTITVTPTQLSQAAASLKTYIETRNKMPTTVTVAGKNIQISQFLQLLGQRVTNLNNGKNSNLKTLNIAMAASPAQSITSGNVQKTDYLSLARTLAGLSSGGKIPNYFTTGVGKLRYESATLLLLKAVNFYDANKRLPGYVYTVKWTGTTTSTATGAILRPVYIVSDNISLTKDMDNARINAVIAELKKLGVTAYNLGIGPDKNTAVLKNTNVPINALVVNFFGGACAATINDMGTAWYKGIKDTRKVHLVFTSGATKITGLSWLPRAYDDTFSPKSFTGLANPAKYLTNNGYKYYEGYTSSKLKELVQILYKEATS